MNIENLKSQIKSKENIGDKALEISSGSVSNKNDVLDMKREAGIQQSKDNLELAKVRASLRLERNFNNSMSEKIYPETGNEDNETAEDVSPKEYKRSILKKLNSNSRLQKILLGLGLITVTNQKIQAESPKATDFNRDELRDIDVNFQTLEEQVNNPNNFHFTDHPASDSQENIALGSNKKKNDNEEVNNEDKKKEALKLALEDSEAFFKKFKEFKDLPEIEEVLSVVRKKDPIKFINDYQYSTFLYGNPEGFDFDNQLRLFSEEDKKLYKTYVSDLCGYPADSLKTSFDNLVNNEDVRIDGEEGVDDNTKKYRLQSNYQRYLDHANILQNLEDFNVAADLQVIKNKDLGTYFRALPNLKIDGIDNLQEVKAIRKTNPEIFLENIDWLSYFDELNIKEELSAIAKESPVDFYSSIVRPHYGLTETLFYSNNDNADFIHGLFEEIKFSPGFLTVLERNHIISHTTASLDELIEVLARVTSPESVASFKRRNIYTVIPNIFKFLNNVPAMEVSTREIAQGADLKPQEFIAFISNTKEDANLYNKNLEALGMVAPQTFMKLFSGLSEIVSKDLLKSATLKMLDNVNRVHLLNYLPGKDDIINNDALKDEILKDMGQADPSLILNFTNVLKILDQSEIRVKTEEIFTRLKTMIFFNNLSAIKKRLNTEVFRDEAIKIAENNQVDFLNGAHDLKEMNDPIINKKIKESFNLAIDQISFNEENVDNSNLEQAIQNYSLKSIQEINALHEQPNSTRFASVVDDSPKELYTKMVYGEEEIFTSSFNGMFNLLKTRLDKKKGGITGKELLDQVGGNKFRIFIKLCAEFNRLDEFLSTMDKTDSDELLIKVINNIENNSNKLSQSVVVADILGNVKNLNTLNILQQQVKSEYERINNNQQAQPEDKIIYGLLSSMFKDNAINEKEWFATTSKDYPLEKVVGIKHQDLFNENGVCVQRYRFYEDGADRDGVNSFNNFIDTYKKQPGRWEIDTSHKGFVIIKGKNGDKKVNIYANIPKVGEPGVTGLEEMDKFMNENSIKSIWEVYRGHSYGPVIPDNINDLKFFGAGSCGGASRIIEILERAPNAHIMSTKGTGSMYINDPILNHINNLVLSGKDLNWREVWDSLPASLRQNNNFKDYIAPNENQALMFTRSYQRLVENMTKGE